MQDEDKLIALARDVATRTTAYAYRRTAPAIDPT